LNIIAIADLHLDSHRKLGGPVTGGINRRGHLILGALERAVERARVEAAVLVIAGDVFDTDHPAPQLIAAAQRILEPVGCVFVKGNHDMVSSQPGDHSLGPLAPVADVIETPKVLRYDGLDLWCVPYQPGPAKDWLPTVMAEMQRLEGVGGLGLPRRLLALHLGLQSEATPPWLQGADDSVPVKLVSDLMFRHGIDAALAGNWHGHREWLLAKDRPLMQIGCAAATGFDNPGTEDFGWLCRYDSKTNRMAGERLPGPRFLAVNDAAELPAAGDLADAIDQGWSTFVRCTCRPSEVEAQQVVLEALRDDACVIEDFTIEPTQSSEATAQARAAAVTAQNAKTFETAVEGYCNRMPLPDPTMRPEVLRRVKEYLR
jgi:hypothetical protein